MKKITFFTIPLFLIFYLNSYTQPANDLPCGTLPELTVNLSETCSNETITFTGSETDSGLGTPTCMSNPAWYSRDLWYTFTMPAKGSVRIITSYNNDNISDPGIEIFTGADCNSLTSYDCADDGNTSGGNNEFFSQIEVTQPATSVVYLRVWDVDDVGAGSINICIYEIDPPLITDNDECSSANDLAITSDCSAPLLTTNFQSTDSAETAPSCISFYEGKDVWYKITLDDNDDYDVTVETFEDSGSTVSDPGLAIYSGSCGALTEIACDDDSGTDQYFSKINLSNRRNEVLYIRVFMVSSVQSGTFHICATATGTLNTTKEEIQDFVLWPNPATHVVNLRFAQTVNNDIGINIYDIQGKLVLNSSNKLYNNKVKINTAFLKSGIYFLKITDGQNEITKKLFIR
ncbi:T9SS type A sorting domain-containing protein [Seonamhaeicola maritimus]|uniref:T9SS type A sorting domain-containing protein n=1 Tax=Seonamhaeicola maritimus TaxID=2591822 RepID=UPI00249488D9|nr:T9SS type A sorting domain-containing protein [Seonamhaeicola maritimus]